MLDNRKIRVMTKLASFEKKEGKEDLMRERFYKTDYVRLQGIKAILGITIAYIVMVGMIFAYYLEYFIENVIRIQYKELFVGLLLGYIILLIFYITITHIKATTEYEKSRKHLRKYYRNLKDLQTIYHDEAAEKKLKDK